MSSEEGAANWRDAQSICFSIPLIPAALQQLRFLSQVDLHRCLYQGPAVVRAIQRYEECWLPLLAATRGGWGLTADDEGLPLQPPLDCAWIWHCHRLNPTAYARDCKAIYGRVLCPAASSMESEERAVGSTCRLWKQHFPQEPYTLDLTQFHYDKQWQPPKQAEFSKLKYNLHEASARQSAFYYQVCLPHMKDEKYLRGAEQRYKGFLHLHRLTENKLFLVPTYDIDLLWHAHQLNVSAYTEDMRRILNRLLPHNDSVAVRTPGTRLEKSSLVTHKLWVEKYGMAYVREGAMYRGEPPTPIPIPPQAQKFFSLADHGAPFKYTPEAPREVIQVALTIVRARDLPAVAKRSIVQVRLRMAKKCHNFRVESRLLDSRSVWNYTLRFEAERTTEGLILEVIQRLNSPIRRKISGSKVLGRMSLAWETLMHSPTQCFDEWFELASKTKLTTESFSRKEPAPSLFISLSWTPPRAGPHLFRLTESFSTDNHLFMILDKSAAGDELWTTRTVLDHADRETFVVRARCKEEHVRIHIHEGGWLNNKSMKKRSVPGKIVFSAEESVTGKRKIANQRSWSFSGSNAQLRFVVGTGTDNLDGRAGLVFDLEAGDSQTQVVLACGRRLQYEIKGAKEEEEEGFVTIIRHNSADSPHGRATALLNWKTGVMEVSAEESVALVLLLSSIIALSVLDRMGLETTVTPKRKSMKEEHGSSDEWGSIVFENTCTSTMPKGFPCLYWWKISSSVEGNSIKGNNPIVVSKAKPSAACRSENLQSAIPFALSNVNSGGVGGTGECQSSQCSACGCGACGCEG